MITELVSSTDGVTVGLHHFEPILPAPSPVVLLLHGAFTGHTIWLRGFAQGLSQVGFDVWLADFRGHGVAAREPAPRTWWFEDLIDRDAPVLIERLRGHIGSRPLGVVGHSAGGVIGLSALARAGERSGIDALVALGTPGPANMGALRYLGAVGFRALALTLGRFPARTLRLGRDNESAQVLGQWMTWNIEGRWLSRDGFDYLEAMSRTRTPYLGVAGGRDLLFSPPYACREIVERLGSPTKDFRIAPSLNHPGLVLHPRISTEVVPQIAAWLRSVLG